MVDLSAPDVLRGTQMLGAYDPETLAGWAVSLNCFDWPADFPIPVPIGWAAASKGRARMRLGHPWYAVLMDMIGQEEFSRAWWVLKLGRSRSAWQDWWDTERDREAVMRQQLGG